MWLEFNIFAAMFHTETRKYGPVEVHLLYFENFYAEEHYHSLLENELERLTAIKHPRRKREFVATRVLRTMVFGNEPICYNEIGAPFIQNVGFISISHAPHVVGLAFCQNFQIGLDLEPFAGKAKRVYHKFLSDWEVLTLNTQSAKQMTKAWSGKEALYKLAGRKGIVFADNLALSLVDEEYWEGKIMFKDRTALVDLKIMEINDFVLSVNDRPIKILN